MREIKTKIPCIKGYCPITIIKVMEQYPGNSGISAFTCETDKGNMYPLSALRDENGKPLSDYQTDEPWYFNEWFRCLWEEAESERKQQFHKQYGFTDGGQEYWYQTDDFKRHYTSEEG